jgi:flagellar biosynthesis chaperone FliJ
MNADEACRQLADAIRDLGVARARIADLESERDQYRELLRESLSALGGVTAQRDRQAERIAALCDELRRYTQRQVREGLMHVVRAEVSA